VSPGAGYYFIKNKTTDLSGEVGPGFISQKLGDTTHDYFTLRLAEKLHHQISDRARVWETVEFLPEVDHFKNYIVNFEVGIEADITADKKFTLRTFLQDTYNNIPATGRKKNDAKLVAALAYKF
jgi:putative salt-induced outer membrane protein YdiY